VTRLHLEPEGFASPGGLVSDLLEGEPGALDLFPPAAFQQPAALRTAAGSPGFPLSPAAFHCPSPQARERLELVLAGGGLVVTTGQQPQLFGGPLYVLYKALTAVRAAMDVERRLGSPCLAVFWVAADDHDWVYPIVEKAKELNICVMVHSDPSIYATPWQVGLLAMDFPDVPVVMAHMGFVDVIYNDAAINMAKRAPNLYLETCGVSAEGKVALAVREIGASRVIHGSDMPFHNPAFDMARIQYADISEEDKKLILGENAQRLLDSLGK